MSKVLVVDSSYERRVSETMTQTADQLHYTVWG